MHVQRQFDVRTVRGEDRGRLSAVSRLLRLPPLLSPKFLRDSIVCYLRHYNQFLLDITVV